MPAKRKPGHPSPYEGREVEISKAIAERLKTGESMVQILRENRFPCFESVDSWKKRFPEIDRMFRAAREIGMDALASQCIEIADAVANNESEDKSADVQAARLQIDTRLRLLGKWDVLRYGDSVAIAHSGQVDSKVTVVSEEQRLKIVELRRQTVIAGGN